MKVGDLVMLRFSYKEEACHCGVGIIIERHNSPEWGAGWEYRVLWGLSTLPTLIYREKELKVING